MTGNYEVALTEQKRHAEEYENQRQVIEAFYKGKGTEDFKVLIDEVAAAMVAIRTDVATVVLGESGDPKGLSVSEVLRKSGKWAPDSLKKITEANNSVIPEHDLSKLPGIISKLTYDQPLTDTERSVVDGMKSSLKESRYLLIQAVNTSHEKGPIDPETAIKASAAIKIIDKQLLPALDRKLNPNQSMEDAIELFSRQSQRTARQSNKTYTNVIEGLANPAPVKAIAAPPSHASKFAKNATVVAASFAAGFGVNEARHQFANPPSHTHLLEEAPKGMDSILKEGAKKPGFSDEEMVNSPNFHR